MEAGRPVFYLAGLYHGKLIVLTTKSVNVKKKMLVFNMVNLDNSPFYNKKYH